MTIPSQDELKELADVARNHWDALTRDGGEIIADILTTLANVTKDEPERLPSRSNMMVCSDYADWQRNGRLAALVDNKKLMHDLQDRSRDLVQALIAVEQLKQQLAEAQNVGTCEWLKSHADLKNNKWWYIPGCYKNGKWIIDLTKDKVNFCPHCGKAITQQEGK